MDQWPLPGYLQADGGTGPRRDLRLPAGGRPLNCEGVCLRKSNRNYVKDAVVVPCPVSAAEVVREGGRVISPWGRPVPEAEVDGRYVYERLVDSRIPGLGPVEMRVTVVRGRVVVAKRKILRDRISMGRIPEVEDVLDTTVVCPDSVFSWQEQERIAAFCDALGLDFGRLDVTRDNADGRVYLLDANKNPSTFTDHPTVSDRMHATMLGLLAQAFVDCYPPRSEHRA